MPMMHSSSSRAHAKMICDELYMLADLQDVVETHLLRDIAARSENFFQAAGVVQDLRGVLARSYVQVKALRQDVSTCACYPACCQPESAPFSVVCSSMFVACHTHVCIMLQAAFHMLAMTCLPRHTVCIQLRRVQPSRCCCWPACLSMQPGSVRSACVCRYTHWMKRCLRLR